MQRFLRDLTKPFKPQPHKMVKHTQTIRRQLVLKGLTLRIYFSTLAERLLTL